nr:Eco57I restriction-modification methylase domain-containing protein [Campylobacter sp.]
FDGSVFKYSRPNSQNEPKHIIQKTLFKEKAKIIENCLFGVDINPNSCEIARLRLWIELLKSSYFTDFSEPNPLKQNALETLPNIDINIKCGNSLVSYFALKNKFSIPNISYRINQYKHAVNLYKAGLGDKMLISNEIKNLQITFKNLCFANEYKEKVKKFKSECDKYSQKYGDYLAKDDLRLARYVSNSFFVEFDENEAKKDFAKLLKLYDETFSLDNLNPFEWRFEFPEILDENGDFMGFDLIIANPPYMQVPKGIFPLKFFPYSEGKDKGKQNTYKVFIEQAYNLVKPQGEVALITQSSIMCDLSATYTRELLLTKTQIHKFVEFPKNISIFTNVIQGVCILLFEKSSPNTNSEFQISIHNDPTKIKKLEFESVKQKDILRFFPANFEIPLIKQGEMAVINKLKTDNEILKNLLSGSLQGNINTIHLKRIESSESTDYFIVKGANIHRYYLDDNFKFAKITDETTKLVQENKKFPVALVSQNITGTSDKFRIHSTIVLSKNTNFVFLDTANILYLQCATQAKYLLALLNSKILDWLFRKTSTNNHVNLYELVNLPIPQITPKNQNLADEIIKLVDKILKETDENERANLSSEIDKLVYQIYDLNADEIALIENA